MSKKKAAYQSGAWSSLSLLVAINIYVVIVALGYWNIHRLPAIPLDPTPLQFNEYNARVALAEIESLGPKVTGSAITELWTPVTLLTQMFKPTWGNLTLDILNPIPATYSLFRDPAGGGPEQACVCPHEYPSDDDLIQRITRLILLCVKKRDLPATTPSWVFQLRAKILHDKHPNQCSSPAEWFLSDLLATRAQYTYGLDLRLPEKFVMKIDSRQLLVAELTKHALFQHFTLKSFPKKSLCTSGPALTACSLPNHPHVFEIERIFIASKSAPLILDTSWSSQYTGHFVKQIPLGGDVTCVYQNLTTLAFKLMPWAGDAASRVSVMQIRKTFLSPSFNSLLGKGLSFNQTLHAALQKVAAVIENKSYPPIPLSPEGIALTTHFDTVIDSPGGADAGSGVVIAVQTLQQLMAGLPQSKDLVMKRPLFVVLNGGEENILQASHGFNQQHPWMLEIQSVVNLEAAGNGGKAFLFRVASSPDLKELRTYQKAVSMPHGSSLAQAVFDFGVIPGLTDFEIYRDEGNVYGLDLSLATSGYYYHSRLDHQGNIPLGTIQHYGTTVMEYTTAMLTAPDIPQEPAASSSSPVPPTYFDLFSRVFVILPSALIFSPLAVAAFWGLFFHDVYRLNQQTPSILTAVKIQVVRTAQLVFTACLCIAANTLFAYALSSIRFQLTWLSGSYMVFVLYSPVPFCVAFECVTMFYDPRWSIGTLKLQWAHALYGLWLVAYTILTYKRSRLNLIFYILLWGRPLELVLNFLTRYLCSALKSSFVAYALTSLCVFQMLAIGFDHFATIAGRLAIDIPADVILAFILACVIVVVFPMIWLLPTLTLNAAYYQQKRTSPQLKPTTWTRYWLYCVLVPFAFSFVLTHPPFTREVPQRIDAVHFLSRYYHLNKTLYKETKGVSLQGTDTLGLSKSYILDPIQNGLAKLTNRTVQYQHVPHSIQSAYFDYPAGASHRSFSNQPLHVFVGVPGPFPQAISPIKKDSPMLQWHFGRSPTTGVDPNQHTSARFPPLKLDWLINTMSPSTKRVTFQVSGPTKMVLLIQYHRAILQWSLSPVLPQPRSECNCYAIINGGGMRSPAGFKFSVDVEPSAEYTEMTIALIGYYPEIKSTILEYIKTDFEQTLADNFGKFVTTVTSTSLLNHYRVPLNPLE